MMGQMLGISNYEVTVCPVHKYAPLIIRDNGPWDEYLTVTNDAERVVQELIESGLLLAGQQLLYYDSEGQLDELLVKDGKFAGFAPGPRP